MSAEEVKEMKKLAGGKVSGAARNNKEDSSRVEKELRFINDDDDDEMDDSRKSKADGNDSYRFIEMRGFPPMVNVNHNHKRVYERRCYVTLFDELLKLIREGRFNAMITGNPGIGKSYFYLYVIFRFIKDRSLLGNWKLVINSEDYFHILMGDVFESIHPAQIRLDNNILRLVDGKTSEGELRGWDGTTILIASPSKASHMKNYMCNYFHMPVWDDEELKDANNLLDPPLKQSESELLEKARVAGPIPRFVLCKETTVEMLRAEIKALIASENMLRPFNLAWEGARFSSYAHRVLKMCPKTSSNTFFSNFTLDFHSREITRLVLYEGRKQVVDEFKRFASENVNSAEFKGNVYEHLIHRHFKNSSGPEILSGKCLDDGSTFEIVLPLNIQMRPAFQNLNDIVLILNQALYAFPALKDHGSYESFLWNGIDTCYIFQITIAEKHCILNHCVKKFLAWIQKFSFSSLVVKFVFVVPSAVIGKWDRPQQLVTTSGAAFKREGSKVSVDQYVVSLDS